MSSQTENSTVLGKAAVFGSWQPLCGKEDSCKIIWPQGLTALGKPLLKCWQPHYHCSHLLLQFCQIGSQSHRVILVLEDSLFSSTNNTCIFTALWNTSHLEASLQASHGPCSGCRLTLSDLTHLLYIFARERLLHISSHLALSQIFFTQGYLSSSP